MLRPRHVDKDFDVAVVVSGYQDVAGAAVESPRGGVTLQLWMLELFIWYELSGEWDIVHHVAAVDEGRIGVVHLLDDQIRIGSKYRTGDNGIVCWKIKVGLMHQFDDSRQ